jgi:mono/diheme cytochrome c family protein
MRPIAIASTLATVGVALGALLVGGSAPTRAADDVRIEEGKALFRQYCSACHGLEANGKGPLASVLTPPPANLTLLGDKYGMPLPKARLAEFIDGRREVRAHGSSDMPVWGRRMNDTTPPSSGGEAQTTGTILLIIDYLESVQVRAKS